MKSARKWSTRLWSNERRVAAVTAAANLPNIIPSARRYILVLVSYFFVYSYVPLPHTCAIIILPISPGARPERSKKAKKIKEKSFFVWSEAGSKVFRSAMWTKSTFSSIFSSRNFKMYSNDFFFIDFFLLFFFTFRTKRQNRTCFVRASK